VDNPTTTTQRLTRAGQRFDALAERLEDFASWRDSRGRALDTDTYDALIEELRESLSAAALEARS
jgi:phage tail tape-measure protein